MANRYNSVSPFLWKSSNLGLLYYGTDVRAQMQTWRHHSEGVRSAQLGMQLARDQADNVDVRLGVDKEGRTGLLKTH